MSYQRILFTQNSLATLRRETASTPTSQQQQQKSCAPVLPEAEVVSAKK